MRMRLAHCCVRSEMVVIKQPIRLVALDLDGTILDEQKKLHEQTIAVIQKVRERGVRVTLATGRALISALPFAGQLGLDTSLITYNGALLSAYPQGNVIEKIPMPMQLAGKLLAELEDAEFYVKVYAEDILYVEETTQTTIDFSEKFSIPFVAVGRRQLRQLAKDPLRIAVIERSGRIKEVWKVLKPWQQHFTIQRDGKYGVEITHKRANKGIALEKLCGLLDIPLSQVMAVGNEGNDLTMLRAAGLGVAMGNACNELKKIADVVTKTNEDLGVAYVLQKYILQADCEF